jgi:hypothetical protein
MITRRCVGTRSLFHFFRRHSRSPDLNQAFTRLFEPSHPASRTEAIVPHGTRTDIRCSTAPRCRENILSGTKVSLEFSKSFRASLIAKTTRHRRLSDLQSSPPELRFKARRDRRCRHPGSCHLPLPGCRMLPYQGRKPRQLRGSFFRGRLQRRPFELFGRKIRESLRT